MNWGATAGGRTLVLLTGAAKINDFMSKLAFRSRFARSGAHFYAQARWFRTLCTGAVVLQNCAKPSRLSAKIARLQNCQQTTGNLTVLTEKVRQHRAELPLFLRCPRRRPPKASRTSLQGPAAEA